MFFSLVSALLVISFGSVVVALWKKWGSTADRIPYPPGPPVKNLLTGNLADIPSSNSHQWLGYTKFGKVYGDIVHFRVFNQHIIVLNSYEAAKALLERRSSIYSSRPHLEIATMMGWDFNAGLKPYGPEWKRHRRLYQQAYRSAATPTFRPAVAVKVKDMLYSLLTTPEDFQNHYKTVAAAIIMSIVYGYDVAPNDDYFVSLSEQATAKLANSVFPGAMAVNAFPILKHLPEWLPGTGFLAFAKETRELTTQMQEVPLDYVKRGMAEGTARPCLALDFMNRYTSEEDYDMIKAVCATSYAGGADTTASALGTFFYAMATHPEIQKKAQLEIDSIVGTERLVTLDDKAALPYVTALCRELLRWRPVLPLGVPHSVIRDDIYNEYYIPKNAIVFSNIWAISHDERQFVNPEELNPERQFDGDGNLRKNFDEYVFGFGRRICPGRHLATESFWLIITCVLSTFDIRLKKDASGDDVPINVEYTPAGISHPLPFECDITPRSKAAERMIREGVRKSDVADAR